MSGPVGAGGADDPDTVGGDPSRFLAGDLRRVLRELREQRELATWQGQELERTNRGVLALHAELDAANARQGELLDAEREARTAVEAARRRLSFLASAGHRLASSLDPDQVLRRLAELVVSAEAIGCETRLLDSHGVPAAAHRSGVRLPETADGPDPVAQAVRTRRPVTSERVLAVPLIDRGQVRAVLGAVLPPDASADATVLLEELAGRAAGALANALRYAHEHTVAQTLQRAMLTDLPQHEGVRLAARYLPASGLNVGGDWYDAFTQPDGSLVVVIGDVTGHGMPAAVTMGQLRQSLRAYALEGHGPGALLTLMHRLMRHFQSELYATAAIARLRPGAREVEWATAGHPPPLLRRPDGGVELLSGGGAMLGLPMEQHIADRRDPFPPGSALLMYTDGLVERRREELDTGLARLVGTMTAQVPPGRAAEAGADAIVLGLLEGGDHDDDVCLLLIESPIGDRAPEEEPAPAAR